MGVGVSSVVCLISGGGSSRGVVVEAGLGVRICDTAKDMRWSAVG